MKQVTPPLWLTGPVLGMLMVMTGCHSDMKPVEVVSIFPMAVSTPPIAISSSAIDTPDLRESAATASSVPAFPGAQGSGAAAIGGRGGRVIEVTNLSDNGPGSLRAALEAEGPRIVVFRVGGIIELQDVIRLRNPYITIAGQTAPGGGILLRRARKNEHSPIRIYAHDVIIRFIRVRTGRSTIVPSGGGDCIYLADASYNVIIDHCSLSWSNDENLSVWSRDNPAHNITFSWNMIAEALSYDHGSCGFIAGSNINCDDMVDIDLHHNFFISNGWRNPLLCIKRSRLVNNIIYNWSYYATAIDGGITCDIIGNLYKKGPSAPGDTRREIAWCPYRGGPSSSGDPSIYIRGNQGPHQSDPDDDNWEMIEEIDPIYAWDSTGKGPPDESFRRTTPLPETTCPITEHSVLDLEDLLFPDVGASMRLDENGNWISNRDAVDERLIQEYLDGTGTIPVDEDSVGGFPTIAPGTPYPDSDHDGMPDAWEVLYGFNPNDPADGPGDADGDGYTNVEEFLNGTDPLGGSICTRVFLPLIVKGSGAPGQSRPGWK